MNIFNFTLKSDDNDGEPSPTPLPDVSGSYALASTNLSKEEIHNRRLGKIVTEPSALLTESSSKTNAPSTPIKTPPFNSNEKIAPLPSPSQPQSTGDIGLKSLSIPNSTSKTTSTLTNSGMLTPNRNARVLNSALESVFLFTLRSDVAGQINENGPKLAYVGSGDDTQLLNSSNVADYICTRLAQEEAGNNSVHYLVSCYKRIISRESTILSEVQAEFLSCKTQCVSFLVTALVNPDMFGENSANSCTDLLQLLGDDTSSAWSNLMRDLAAELATQDALTSIVHELAKRCYDQLNAGVDQALRNPVEMMRMMGQPPMHSVLDTVTQPLTALCALARSDKRVARALTQVPMFRVEASLRSAAPQEPRFNGIFAFAASTASNGVVQGAAVSEKTLLGRLLRNVVDYRDPQFQQLFNNVNRMSRTVAEGHIAMVRSRLNAIINGVHEIIKNMLVSGSPGKEDAIAWLMDAVALNSECEKDQPSHLIGASRGFMLNLLYVLLQLCRPFLLDETKLKKVDWRYLISDESANLLPRSATPLMTPSAGNPSSVMPPLAITTSAPANFMTQSFFMALRALHLSYAPMCRDYDRLLMHMNRQSEAIQNGDPRAIQLLHMKLAKDCELLQTDMMIDIVNFSAALSFVLLNGLREDGEVDFNQSILHAEQLTNSQKIVLAAVPEYALDDLMTCLVFVAKNRADLLSIPQMAHVLDLALFFLRRPAAVRSPHVRAKLGELLFQVFLPNKERDNAFGWNERYTSQHFADGLHSHMMESVRISQLHLAPTLLLLYGDVERTGFYEKMSHRRRISAILKHLWELQSHRPAFRGIALSQASISGDGSSESSVTDSEGASFFIRFANGLLNETNKLVSETLTSLGSIKEFQSRRNSAEWAAMSDEARKEMDDKLHEAEGTARHSAGLCLETVHMVNYLTTDEVIQKPFLQKEILPRLVSMIFNVIYNMSGAKGLEFKVDNMESYNFKPKDMLREVCESLLHVCSSTSFQEAAVNDAFFKEGKPLSKAIAVITKHGLMSPTDIAQLSAFNRQVSALALDAADLDKLLEDAPEKYLDPLLLTLMEDPVLLTTSNNIVNRATIMTQLLNDPIDPFNRSPLSLADIKPCPELKQEIEEWIHERKRSRRAALSTTSQEQVVSVAATPAVDQDSAMDDDAEIAAAIALSLQDA